MSEKLVVRVHYALEDEAIKKKALEDGIQWNKVQQVHIPLMELDANLRNKVYEKYLKGSMILMDITDRSVIANRTEKEIELFHDLLTDVEKIKDIIEEYFEECHPHPRDFSHELG